MTPGRAARVPPLAPLLAISPPETDAAELRRWAEALAAAGLTWLQIRAFALDDGELLATLRTLRSHLRPDVRLTINGRPDLCRLAGLDGVHLPARGLPVAATRRVAGAKVLVGRSTHSLAEVRQAAAEGADYALFGPVYTPLSKPAARPATGLQELGAACAAGLPVLALGGVTISRFGELAAAGAAGAAGISMFDPAADPGPLLDRAASAFHPSLISPPLSLDEPPRTA
jgi:thiamine-phosphate diphosphorylase